MIAMPGRTARISLLAVCARLTSLQAVAQEPAFSCAITSSVSLKVDSSAQPTASNQKIEREFRNSPPLAAGR
jgi:hypothetical protein